MTAAQVILRSGKGLVFRTERSPEYLEGQVARGDGPWLVFRGVNDVGADVVAVVARDEVAALVCMPERAIG